MELMKEYCHLGRSLKDCIPIEYDITVDEAAPSKDRKKSRRE
jgi:hypothetical protein